ncbi:hypothetical protein CYMTET_8819 [Cymbomonas tetramitiformis]|uniref:Short chain dehydrogenase n=1 Tax=Cymbomonas tetramitiformis TaxID=36881 RepID=A0AAE0GSA7_9CHLO|nr:hypothetical protein CYMTET_8819 [Cymbomonas tetramitiformis]
MGKATAKLVVEQGGEVLIASRSAEKLRLAQAEIVGKQGAVTTKVLDNTDEIAVKEFFDSLEAGEYNALVISAADRAVHGSFLSLEVSQVKALFESKFWGAYFCAKYGAPKLAPGGSIVFFSGVLNRRPGLNCSPLASVNGAIEGLTRALALELGPRLRVNCFSPGFMETERFDHMEVPKKQAMLESTAQSLPLRRVGQPEDAAAAIYFLMSNSFTTGIVLDCDGGHQIRQYASQVNDPFRGK